MIIPAVFEEPREMRRDFPRDRSDFSNKNDAMTLHDALADYSVTRAHTHTHEGEPESPS
jgi:hypothetical protein